MEDFKKYLEKIEKPRGDTTAEEKICGGGRSK